ncbi:60S ribosomal protein L35a-1-like [Glycine soja]|nr:60S ribosomal protein L35a-1-like [Glycine soja]
MEWALQKNPSWPAPFDSVYKNPETDITTPSAELSRREKEEQEASPLPNMVKGRQGERVRLYVRGSILGYKRSKSNQYPNTSLIQIENVNTKEEVAWYCGKRMAYIYKAKVKKDGSHYRCIWGKVTRPHGNSGIVRAKFKSNLPPRSMGARVRVFMYPSNI